MSKGQGNNQNYPSNMAQIHSQGPPLLLTGERYGGGRSSTRSWSRGVPMSLSVSYTYYWHNIPRFKVNATTRALALLYTLHVTIPQIHGELQMAKLPVARKTKPTLTQPKIREVPVHNQKR